jgi:hypothetical protein
MQCNEINSNYFQVFYCPALNNYYKFKRLELNENYLRIISDETQKCLSINLSNFTLSNCDYDCPAIKTYINNFDKIRDLLIDETITDIIEC